MFEWFKDLFFEMRGIDMHAAKKENIEKKDTEKTERFIFTKGMKTVVIGFGVLYILMSTSSIALLINSGGSAYSYIKYGTMIIIALAVIFCLSAGNKKGEIYALAGIALFLLGLYISILMI